MDALTPGEVRDVVFDHAPMFRRGYDEAQVDEFLDRVEGTLVAMQVAMREKVQELDRSGQWPTDPAGPPGPPTGPQHRAVADQTIADARRRADQIVENARMAAQRVVEEARAEAFRMVADASRKIVRGVNGGGGDPELSAAAVEAGHRLAQIRDALNAEVSNLFTILDRMDDGVR